MKLAKWVFLVCGVYGILVIAPLYFLEAKLGRDYPPAINHPELYYGFTGVGLAWQVLFILVSRDPVRYRAMMIPAFLEKATYAGAVAVLVALGRTPATNLGFAAVDTVMGVLFLVAWAKTRAEEAERFGPRDAVSARTGD